jgi:glycosyltransferase involved in cell wall biosynthesis
VIRGNAADRPALSLVVPAYNEEESLPALYDRIVAALGEVPSWELILVDDGSEDGTGAAIRDLERSDPRVRGIRFARNQGQTAAIAAGFEVARAPLIATLDADLQNDPMDLPGLLDELEDHDAVVGYRVNRQDPWLRRASARVANVIRDRVTGDRIRDTGCSLRVFRAVAVWRLTLFEGMHRFLPTLLRFHGFRVIERPVAHHPRRAGRSKYGIRNRAWLAFKDLLAVRWMGSRIIKARAARSVEDRVPPRASASNS